MHFDIVVPIYVLSNYIVFNKYIMTNFNSSSDVIINTIACLPPGTLQRLNQVLYCNGFPVFIGPNTLIFIFFETFLNELNLI